jgi:hypothetical protein
LYRNASLKEVHLNGFCEILSTPESRARQAIIVRTIDAITTRNRLLPGLLTRPLVVPNDHGDTPSPTTAAAFRQFPALCVVSTHAPRMAANTLLKGLLPVLDAFEPIHRRGSKRIYNDQA